MDRLLTRALFIFFLGGQLLLAQQPSRQVDSLPESAVKSAQPKPDAQEPGETEPKDSPAARNPSAKGPKPSDEISEAEKIARLQRAIDGDQQRLSELQQKRDGFEREFQDASADFKELDGQLEERTEGLQKLRDAGKQQQADEAEKSITEIKKKWTLAKERFDLAIEQRKLAQEQLAALQKMTAQDEEALKRLTNAPPTASATEPKMAQPAAPPAPAGAQTEKPAPEAAPPPESAKPTAASDALPTATAGKAPSPSKPPSAEVEAASKAAAEKEQAAKAAEESASEVTKRLQALDKNIRLEREAIESSRKLADNAQQSLDSLEQEYQKALDAGATAAKLQGIRQEMQEAQKRLRDARAESRELSNNLDEMQSERATILAEQMAALKKARLERDKADEAKRKYAELQNPFTLKNMLQWLFEHGPNLCIVLVAAVLLLRLVRALGRRATKLIVNSSNRGSNAERENRANTLVSVFQNTATLMIYVGSILTALQEVGVPIVPLIGGAAVAGLAVAFGAQNLVKDYFYGFMILLENQYRVNDVVTIAGVSGLVECVTLRMTMLRDLEGVAHFIPHSSVTTVSNMTHGWSRTVFDIGVAYNEDVDHVMEVLMQLAREFRHDEEFGKLVLADPDMLGVDSFGDSAVVIKFMLKTRPLMQWTVKRELNRRIKNKFDELGIVIPFPHRTVYCHTDQSGNGELAVHDRESVREARP